jgi:hypothetical protein
MTSSLIPFRYAERQMLCPSHHSNAAITTPTAMAGAYAKRLSASGDSIAAAAADPSETSRAVALSV